MKIFADLHIHSPYSRAVSKDMSFKTLERVGALKGLNVLGTGDLTHPKWREEIRQLEEKDGLFRLKGGKVSFLLSGEVNTVFEVAGRSRRIHHLILLPYLEAADLLCEILSKRGKLEGDGRPTLSMTGAELVEETMEFGNDCMVIPAHIWTPWFSLFGAKGGVDRIEECYEDQTPHIYALETGLSCYDKETEVLTDKGWKHFDEVEYKDEVCTLDIETNEIQFQKPTKIHSYNYRGNMYRLKTKRVDLLVTPNHNLLCSKCDFHKPPKFILDTAENLFSKSKRFKKDGIWRGKDDEYFILPAVKIKHGSRHYFGMRDKEEKALPMKPWLKFLGFWIAEGWTSEGKNGDYNVCISNRNISLIHEMGEILHDFGYNTFWNDKTSTLRVRDFQLFQYLKQFGKCCDKYVPDEVKSVSKDLIGIFLEYYIKGNGHIYGRNLKGLSATTSSIRLRDDLQEIALKIGMSAYYKLDKKKGTPILSLAYDSKKKDVQRGDAWVVYFIRKNVHIVLPSSIKKYKHTESWVDFEGPVFCVTVPNHVVYVRRNGIPVWCGNSDPPMNWRVAALDNLTLVSNSDSHSPLKIGREANIIEVEHLSYKDIVETIMYRKDRVATIEVDPAYGKYHWTGHRNCGVSFSPAEAAKLKGVCPVCGKLLTKGVAERVEELADKDRPEGFVPAGAQKFLRMLPLIEVVGLAAGKNAYSAEVQRLYWGMLKELGSEMDILLSVPLERLSAVAGEAAARLIMKNREGKLCVEPGYDGVYGKLMREELCDE